MRRMSPWCYALFLLLCSAPAAAQDLPQMHQRLQELVNAGNYKDAAVAADKYADATRLQKGDHRQEYGIALNQAAYIHANLGDYSAAESRFRTALEILTTITQPNLQIQQVIAQVRQGLAIIWIATGRSNEAIPELEILVGLQRSLAGPRSTAYAVTLTMLGSSLLASGHQKEAIPMIKEAVDIWRSAADPQDPQVGGVRVIYGGLLFADGDIDAAEREFKAALVVLEKPSQFRPQLAGALTGLSMVAQKKGDLAASEDYLNRVLVLQLEYLGKNHPDRAATLASLSDLAVANQDGPKAQRLLNEALEIVASSLGQTHPRYVDLLLKLADLRRIGGDAADGADLIAHARKLQEQAGRSLDDPQWAETLHREAELARNSGDLESAERLERRALEIVTKQYPPDHPSVAERKHALGLVLSDEGKLPEAEELLTSAFTFRDRLAPEHDSAIIFDLVALAMLNERKGDLQKTMDYLQQALRRMPADPRLALPLNVLVDGQIAIIYGRQDNPAAAEPYVNRMSSTFDSWFSPTGVLAGNARLRAELSRTFGVLLAQQGRNTEAAKVLRESFAIYSKLGLGHPDAVQGAIALATLQAGEGNFSASAAVLRDTLAAVRPGSKEDAILSAQLAEANLSNGDLQRAKELLLHSRDLMERPGELRPALPDCYLLLGEVSEASGDTAEARRYWDRAAEIAKNEIDPNHPVIASVEISKAKALIGGSKAEVAEGTRLASHARTLIEGRLGRYRPEVSEATRTLALLQWSGGDLEGARSALEQLVAMDEEAMPHRLILSGESRFQSVLERSSPSDLYVSFHLRGLPDDRAAARLALRAVLQRKGTLQDLLAEQARLQHTSSEAELLYSRWAQLENTSRSCGEPSGSLQLIPEGKLPRTGICAKDVLARGADVSQALQEFVAKAPSFGAAAKPVEISQLAEVLRGLGGYVLAEIVQYTPISPKAPGGLADPGRYAAYILLPDEQIEWVDLGSQKEIDDLTARMRELQSDPNSPEADAMRVARELDKMVMQPIRAKLGGRTRLFVAPDGDLNMIDFSSLVDERNQYLIDKYQIAGLTSGRDLLRFAGSQSHHPTAPAADVVFEDPSFQAAVKPPQRTEQSGNPATPVSPGPLGAALGCEAAFLKQEWTGVSLPPDLLKRWVAALPGATFFKEADANKWNLVSLHSPRTLWLLTHGFFCTDAEVTGIAKSAPRPNFWRSPMDRGALVLAGGAASDPTVRRNGYITATEIAEINLQDTELVVLGACETALGVAHVGDGVHGLRRALILAGARSQVMTLWKVRGSETFSLLSDFASRLPSGVDRLTALRAAQLKIREAKGTRHPYFWAGIYFMGFPGPLNALPIPPNVR